MSVNEKMTAIANAIREKTGGVGLLTLDGMAAAIAGLAVGGGGGVKVTEYVVTEDADRSLWLNEQQIKLVKGVNLILLGGWQYGSSIVDNRAGLVTLMCIFWDGVAVADAQSTLGGNNYHVRGWHFASNGYTYVSGTNAFCAGYTTKVSVDADGLLEFTTSATGVTTGNYANSFLGAGNTYYLLQAESEVVC